MGNCNIYIFLSNYFDVQVIYVLFTYLFIYVFHSRHVLAKNAISIRKENYLFCLLVVNYIHTIKIRYTCLPDEYVRIF